MIQQKKFNTKSPIIFNEYEYGKYLSENSDNKLLRPKKYNIKELVVLAKYYRSIADDRTEVRNKLIQFCNINYIGFDPDVKYEELNQAIETAFETKMRTCNGVPITKNEWEKIQLIEDEKGQKILFVMLAVSKFNRLNPIIKEEDEKEIVFKDKRLRCYLQDKDLFRLAKVQFRNIHDYYHLYRDYGKYELLDLIPANISKVVLNFGDLEPTEEDIMVVNDKKIIITDMDNLMEVFKVLKYPETMKSCKKCGNWFEIKTIKGISNSKAIYCKDCRKHQTLYDKEQEKREAHTPHRKDQVKENEIKTFVCVDCGQVVGKNKYANNLKIRCISCQEKYKQSLLIGEHSIKCTNCGKELIAKSGNNKTTLCDECYKIERRRKKTEAMRNARAKHKE